MKRLITSVIAAGFFVAGQIQGAQVYTPPPPGGVNGNLPLATQERSASWSTNTLYIRGGTPQPRVALHAHKDISELDIADIAQGKSDFAAVDVVRLDALVDPLIGESLSMMNFNSPANAVPRKQLLAIAWLFAIGLIGMATVGRRRNKF